MDQTVRRGVNLTEDQWRKAKAMAALRGQTVSQWIAGFIDEWDRNSPKSDRGAQQPLRVAQDLAMDRDPEHISQERVKQAVAKTEVAPGWGQGNFRPVPKPSSSKRKT